MDTFNSIQELVQHNHYNSLVIHKNVAAFDVAMQKVLLVTILQSPQQLLHDARNVNLLELNLLVLHQAHQIVLHVLKDEVESAAVLAEVDRLLLVGDDLAELHDVLVVQLTENFDFSNGRDWKPFLLVFEADFLQRHDLFGIEIACLVYLPIGT